MFTRVSKRSFGERGETKKVGADRHHFCIFSEGSLGFSKSCPRVSKRSFGERGETKKVGADRHHFCI
ncbi:hypothetical protein, partial [Sediminicola sp. 1XM1-17]|uniref:hypothetical protein n=1 Tax=Sediminicola sp. 1XM1-17 TaxID=3127702 RepID=UPI00307769BA